MTSKEAREWDEAMGITPQREGAVPQYVGPRGRYKPEMPEGEGLKLWKLFLEAGAQPRVGEPLTPDQYVDMIIEMNTMPRNDFFLKYARLGLDPRMATFQWMTEAAKLTRGTRALDEPQ